MQCVYNQLPLSLDEHTKDLSASGRIDHPLHAKMIETKYSKISHVHQILFPRSHISHTLYFAAR